MTRQIWRHFALTLGLLGLALLPSTSLAQVGLGPKLPGKNPASAEAQAASRQAKTPGAPSYTYTLLSFPGSLDTIASGINPGATTSKMEIVGAYSGTGAFVAHVSGTKTFRETYEGVKYPRDASPIDINDLGQIVGDYLDSSGVYHGFELSDKKFTTIDVPFAGATGTNADAINNSGEIVGSWSDSGVTQGFTLIDGTYTSLNYPGADYTFAFDVNNEGDIVGSYASPDSNGSQCYLLSGGTYTSISVPGAAWTEGIAINDAGVIVGYYGISGSSLIQGFVLSGGGLHDGHDPRRALHGFV